MTKRALVALLPVLMLGCPASKSSVNVKEIENLERQVRDKEPAIQAHAALELGKYGPDAARAVPALASALSSEDISVRRNAALALGKIGPAARSASGALHKALTDSDYRVREYAVFALGEIGDARALPDVQAMRADGVGSVKQAAIKATEKLKR
jgi:HEAT repeat protein